MVNRLATEEGAAHRDGLMYFKRALRGPGQG